MEPVTVLGRERGPVELRLPRMEGRSLACEIQFEDRTSQKWTVKVTDLATARGDAKGHSRAVRRLSLPQRVPQGYHRLSVETGGEQAQALLLVPPAAAYTRKEEQDSSTWGVFLPLHALRTRQSWAGGDFGDLEALDQWIGKQGGGVVATLPFLAAFLDEPCEPSPYTPVSKLFWNEFFLDIDRIPELQTSEAAQQLMQSASFEAEIKRLREAPLVNYKSGMALKRRVLESLADTLLAGENQRRTLFEEFLRGHPVLQDYARFRAAHERHRIPWQAWPARLRDGTVQDGDFDPRVCHYHSYVQWLAHQQLHHFAQSARRAGPGLYLDLPLGVHPDGYDVWRHREIFARGVSGGAPPDSFFTKGQDWGFPPLHPERLREQGYAYFIACVRHHLRYAGILRIDHVMGLHRLFWVPWGMKAVDGVYVRYRAEEFYAILAIESQRHQALLMGEDLGTVPSYVRPAMARHKINRSYVAQYELNPGRQALRPVGRDTLAGINTHDMPTFAGFWNGLDINDRVEMHLLAAKEAPKEKSRRQRLKSALIRFLRRHRLLSKSAANPGVVLEACLAWLGGSAARVVTVNLEDLWGERLPQNVPGTTTERPNWRRKARYPLEEIQGKKAVLKVLSTLDAARRRGG